MTRGANTTGPGPGAARRSAPAALRNRDALLDVLRPRLTGARTVLEIASGTGEHAVYFQAACPHLVWRASDPDPDARVCAAAWAAHAGLDMPPPLDIDAAAPGWETAVPPADAAVCINMIHIAPAAAAEGLMRGAARLLPPGGRLFLYGPFREAGAHTSPSNAAFDLSLRAQNPAWGVRDLDDVSALAAAQGFAPPERIPMPAHNLTVVFRLPGGHS